MMTKQCKFSLETIRAIVGEPLPVSRFHLQLARDLGEIHSRDGKLDERMVRTVVRLLTEHEHGGTCLLLAADDWRPMEANEFFHLEQRAAGEYLYFARYWEAEQALRTKLTQLIAAAQTEIAPTVSDFRFKGGWGYNTEQLAAVEKALSRQFTIITGGPGTGKTTVVFAVLAELYRLNPDLRVALAAPTGKAAQRMSESIRASLAEVEIWPTAIDADAVTQNIEALSGQTYHRLLHYSPRTTGWAFNAANPLPFEVVIVDEASMIDLVRARAIFDAVGPDAKLILLGDPNQLPSVEEGTVLADLLSDEWGGGDVVARLVEAHRFRNPMKALVTAVNECRSHDPKVYAELVARQGVRDFLLPTEWAGGNPFMGDDTSGSAFVYLWEAAGTLAEVGAAVESWWRAFGGELRRLCTAFDPDAKDAMTRRGRILDILHSAQMLTVVRSGSWGCDGINQHLSQKAGGASDAGMPIIITKNDPALGLNNGDTGVLVSVSDGDTGQHELMVLIDGHDELLPCRILPEYEPAYAITIHKSQGSQYRNVLVVLPPPEAAAAPGASKVWTPLMTKELVYTGITRAKNRAFVCGSRSALLYAFTHPSRRQTGRLIDG